MHINNLSTNVLFVSVSDGFAVIVSLIPLRGLVDFSLILDRLIRPHHCHETWSIKPTVAHPVVLRNLRISLRGE